MPPAQSNLKSYIILFLTFLLIGGAVYGFISPFIGLGKNDSSSKQDGDSKSINLRAAIEDLNFPSHYNETLSLLNNTFSIQPLEAQAAQATSEQGKNAVRYVDAYTNTDVVETKYSSMLKEDIILKQPGHPEEFNFQIDAATYDFEKNQDGDFVFYQKGKKGDELYRLFTIPAPFMVDADKKKSSTQDVASNLTDEGQLTITPNQEWLKTAKYPVVLDPTIEINIINVHSHPEQGENWTVDFTTQGQADLKIIPNDQATIDDDEFVSLSCGDQKMTPQILAGDVIFYPNWSCDKTATVIHYTKKAGNHTLRFEFGDQVAYAYNTSSVIIMRQNVTFRTGAFGAQANVDLMEYSSDANAQTAYVTNGSSSAPTGGTITYTDSNGANPRSSPAYSGGYTVHTFKTNGTFTTSSSGNVSVLVLGGGGNSGIYGGGGGSGGLIYKPSHSLTAGSFTVTVGNGGQNSTFNALTAKAGGQGGAQPSCNGYSGGSGGGCGNCAGSGGAATQPSQSGDSGTYGFGTNGGNGGSDCGSGGGGAGSSGGTSPSCDSENSVGVGGAGGNGKAYSISGNSVYYAGGGGGYGLSIVSSGGSGGGGNGSKYYGGTNGVSGAANTGGGGGGGLSSGVAGGSGIVIIRYLTSDFLGLNSLQSYSESTIKTQGAYALKGVSAITSSLNKTLTRTIASPLNFTDRTAIAFDIRSTRTGSNIKVGIHDTGGTTTESTPNITSANAYQTVTWNISGVSNANKDAIDKIIITIVNADADNTFYIDNMILPQEPNYSPGSAIIFK